MDLMNIHVNSSTVNEQCFALLSQITLFPPLRDNLMKRKDVIKLLTDPIRVHAKKSIITVNNACNVLVNLAISCKDETLKPLEQLGMLEVLEPLTKKVKKVENHIRTLIGHLKGEYGNIQLQKPTTPNK